MHDYEGILEPRTKLEVDEYSKNRALFVVNCDKGRMNNT